MTLQLPLSNPGIAYSKTVAHQIAAALKRHDIEFIFGQSLPTMVCLACEEAGIRQIVYRTENAGGYMADAYARVSGKPGIVTAQNGPAAALLVAPLAEALKASIPIIALVQDVNRDQTDKNAFQDLDHIGLFAPVAKWVRRVTEPSRIEDYIDQAFVAACSGRPGPVVLLLPADLLIQPALPTGRRANLGYFPLDRTVAAPATLDEAARLIASALRPIIIVGGGIHTSRATVELARLQEAAHLPVATTVMGKGAIDETHALSIGVLANFLGPNGATRYHRAMIANADVVILVGTRTNQNGTDSWQLYPTDAKFIHIDVDGNEIGRNYEAIRLVGDAKLTISALTDVLSRHDLSQHKKNRLAVEASIASAKQKHLHESKAVRRSGAKPIRPERIMDELQAQLTAHDIVVADASYSSIWIANYLTALKGGMRFLTPRGLAGLGWGFPMALGARLAHSGGEVFCVVGDGGFGHVWSELETARRMNIKVILVVINNGILGFQKHAENVKFRTHTTAVHFLPVDHVAIANATGCVGIRVEDPDDLPIVFARARSSESTILVEVICDPNAFPPITFFTPEEMSS